MSEFVPKPEEKTEDQAREVHGVQIAQEITELRSSAKSEEDYRAVLHKISELRKVLGIGTEGQLSGEVSEQIEKAKKIMGEDFAGVEAIESAFGFTPDMTTIPEIQFSESDLERAKELGQILVLRVDKAQDGSQMTMEKIESLSKETATGDEGLLYDTSWYKEEEFYKNDAVQPGWALVSKEVIPDSTSKNYLEQTETLVDYLRDQVYGPGKELPKEYQLAISEFESQKASIAELLGSDWQKASERLSKLAINEFLRQTPAEVAYDLLLRYHTAKERLLPDVYTWTQRRSSDGGLVSVGSFESGGVHVNDDYPGNRGDDLGVSFSRSL